MSEHAIADAPLSEMNEQQLRDYKVPWPETMEELSAIITQLTDRQHDYGTCVYAMSIAATAAFYHVAKKLGVTGFQASCADMDILTRTRHMERFRISDYANLLYPQYCDAEHFPGWRDLLGSPELRPWLRERAQKLLAERENAHPNVVAHWEMLSR